MLITLSQSRARQMLVNQIYIDLMSEFKMVTKYVDTVDLKKCNR